MLTDANHPWNNPTAQSLDDFEQKLFMLLPRYREELIFRGQAVNVYPLPRFHRSTPPKAGLAELEKRHIQDFREKFSLNLTDISGFSYEWKTLTLLQHFGGFTRFLDWSRDFRVALWFAISARLSDIKRKVVGENNQATVWIIRPLIEDWIEASDAKGLSPTMVKKIKYFAPLDVDMRVENQASIFSVHPIPNHPFDSVTGFFSDWNKMRRNCRMFKIPISDSSLYRLRADLKNSGICRGSIYPKIKVIADSYKKQYNELDGLVVRQFSSSIEIPWQNARPLTPLQSEK